MLKYNIAVCDDYNHILIHISNILKTEFAKIGLNAEITAFDNPISLINSHKTNKYDVIFLDIEMPDMDGIEAGKIIKNLSSKALIIFLTSKDELVYKSFEAHPYSFIRKTYMDKEIPKIINDIKEELSKNEYMLKFKIENINYKLYLDDIIYIESKRNYIIIHTIDDAAYKYKDSINKKEDELSKYDFIRSHESFLINLKYIKHINKKTVTLILNLDIPVSRYRMISVKESFLEYHSSH